MTGFLLLLFLVLAPVAGALSLLLPIDEFEEERAPWGVALLTSLTTLGLAVVATARHLAGVELGGSVAWLPDFGVHLSLAMDGVTVWFVLLVGVITPVVIVASRGQVHGSARPYYLFLLLLQAAFMGVFLAADLIVFYVFFELTLIPTFFLLAGYGLSRGRLAAATYFLYAFTGSMLTLASILYLGWWHSQSTGSWSFALADLAETAPLLADRVTTLSFGLGPIDVDTGLLVMLGLLAGFLVKVPIWPLHHYLPLAHREAPAHGGVDAMALVLKLGPFAILKIALPLCPAAAVAVAPTLGVLAVISILAMGLICWMTKDAKRLLAYSSVSHMGFVVLGLFALDADRAGAAGAAFYILAYTLSAGALFLMIGMLHRRVGTYRLDEVGGLARVMPVWSCFLVFFVMASVGLPGLNGFVGEFLTVLGTFGSPEGVLGPVYAVPAVLGVVVAAMYLLKMVGRCVFGEVRVPLGRTMTDLDGREVGVLVPLAVLCLGLGLMPQPVLDAMRPTVEAWTAPAVAAAHESKPDDAAPDDAGLVVLSEATNQAEGP